MFNQAGFLYAPSVMIFILMEVYMILDNYVDNRMMKLYEILTNTDFKGNIKDERVISL